jgi:hypothetical protein
MLVLVDHHDVIMQFKECRSNAFNAYVHYVSKFRFERRHMTKYRDMSCGGPWKSTKSQLSTLPSSRICTGML